MIFFWSSSMTMSTKICNIHHFRNFLFLRRTIEFPSLNTSWPLMILLCSFWYLNNDLFLEFRPVGSMQDCFKFHNPISKTCAGLGWLSSWVTSWWASLLTCRIGRIWRTSSYTLPSSSSIRWSSLASFILF